MPCKIDTSRQAAEEQKKASPPVDGADRLTMKFGLVSKTPGGETNAQISFEVTGLDGFRTVEDQDALLRHFAQCSHQVYMELARRIKKIP